MSASGLVIMSCSPNTQANILPLPTLPDAITSVYNTHFTHTSHPKETLLSSAFYPLPENSGRDREGFKLSLTLPNSLGREKVKTNLSDSNSSYLSYSGLTGVSRSEKTAKLFHPNHRIKSEDDTSLVTSLLRREGQGKKIKLASVCFVTDTEDCSGNEFANADDDNTGHGAPGNQNDYNLDNAERCKKEGYNKNSCLPGEVPANFCPYDSNYFEKCVCPDGYKTCTPPYYGVGTACGNKYASCEKDTERAGKEENPNYVTSCPSGQQFSSDRCSYDSSYGICCNTCAGYPYTADTIPEGYVQDGESCTGCDGQDPKPAQTPASPEPQLNMTTANPVPTSVPSPAVPTPIPVPMRNAPTATIKQAASLVTTGMKGPKLAHHNAQFTTCMPATALMR